MASRPSQPSAENLQAVENLKARLHSNCQIAERAEAIYCRLGIGYFAVPAADRDEFMGDLAGHYRDSYIIIDGKFPKIVQDIDTVRVAKVCIDSMLSAAESKVLPEQQDEMREDIKAIWHIVVGLNEFVDELKYDYGSLEDFWYDGGRFDHTPDGLAGRLSESHLPRSESLELREWINTLPEIRHLTKVLGINELTAWELVMDKAGKWDHEIFVEDDEFPTLNHYPEDTEFGYENGAKGFKAWVDRFH